MIQDGLDLPRASEVIREQLSDLREVMARAGEYGARDFASKVLLSSLAKNEAILLN